MFNGILKGLNIGNIYFIPIISGTYYLGYFVIGYILHNRFKDKKIDILNSNLNSVLLMKIDSFYDYIIHHFLALSS